MKAVTAAQLAMASDGVYRVTLDEAIEAMRLTAADMSVKYKETSLSVSVSCVTWFWRSLIPPFQGLAVSSISSLVDTKGLSVSASASRRRLRYLCLSQLGACLYSHFFRVLLRSTIVESKYI